MINKKRNTEKNETWIEISKQKEKWNEKQTKSFVWFSWIWFECQEMREFADMERGKMAVEGKNLSL